MKNKTILKTVTAMFIISGMYLSLATPTYAYWQVFGIQIPTNLEEFKVIVFAPKKVNTQEEITARKQKAEEFRNKLNEQNNGAQEKNENTEVDQDKEMKNEEKEAQQEQMREKATELKDKLDDKKNDSDSYRKDAGLDLINGLKINEEGNIVISKDKIESILSKTLVGKTYFNYTVKDVSVELEDGKGYLTLYLNDDKAIKLEIVSSGNQIEIANVESVGGKSLSFFENIALQQGIKSMPSLIDEFVPASYKEKIENIKITKDGIIVNLNN